MSKSKTIKMRCGACDGAGAVYDSVRDDSRVSGYRTVSRPCPDCISGAVLRPAPRSSKLKGVATATVHVCHSSGEEYNLPSIALRAPMGPYDTERGYGDVVCEVAFQRHRLDSSSRGPSESDRPDPRFDVGSTPWGSCYAGKVLGGAMGFSIDAPSALTRVAAIVSRLLAARALLPRGVDRCALAGLVDALALLGVPVEVQYYTRGANAPLTADELRAEVQAGRIQAGTGAAVVDAALASAAAAA